jgi:hypothetical protein
MVGAFFAAIEAAFLVHSALRVEDANAIAAGALDHGDVDGSH